MIEASVHVKTTMRPEPPISFPFLWRSKATANVYLRVKAVGYSKDASKDVVLHNGDPRQATMLGITTACNHDDEAWSLRLRNEEVILYNSAD